MKMETESADVYCLREFQDTVADSVHRVFKDSVQKRLNLTGWQILENKIIAPNGSKTTYKGANRNPDSMQSAQGYKYSWFEEAHRASKDSLDKLLPTIIRNVGSECWFSANPQSSLDPFSQRFIVPYQAELDANGIYEDDIHLIIVVNWRDNPWWNEEQEALRKWDYENRPRTEYDWIWEGKYNDHVENAIIPAEWFDAAVDAHIKLGFKPRGIKVASHDPADSGDARGYALRHGSVILDVQENTKDDVNDACDWALDLAIQDGADLFVWDGDGMGVSLKRQVAASLKGKAMDYEMYRGSDGVENPEDIYQDILTPENDKQKKKNKHTFKNYRAQYHWKLRDRFLATYRAVVKKEYIDPDEVISISSDIKLLPKLRAEICGIPKIPNGNGLIQIMAKKDMISKLKKKSPNIAESVIMSLKTKLPAIAHTSINFDSEF
jgi:phage terminase large subunit